MRIISNFFFLIIMAVMGLVMLVPISLFGGMAYAGAWLTVTILPFLEFHWSLVAAWGIVVLMMIRVDLAESLPTRA